jgi:acetyl-CoA carboxylase biotin carboxyl carrier protein
MATRRAEHAERGQPEVEAGQGAFTLDEVKALVKVLEGTDVTTLRWQRNGQQIVIRRGRSAAPAAVAPPVPLMVPHANALAAAPPPAPAAAPAAAPKAESKPGAIVTSPFVGTFYRAPSPESPPFVEVGSVVKKGQVLCIVEAMKLMNEIEAEGPGKIAEIFVQNATPVEFGQPLFRVEPIS